MTVPLIDTLLLTAAGGDIALSIARIMREDGLVRRIVGADARVDHAGFAFYDDVFVLPRADQADYPVALQTLIEREQPTITVPVSDAELSRLLAAGLLGDGLEAGMLTANFNVLQVGLDKWLTYLRLEAAGITTPRTGIIGESMPDDCPFMVKPRHGQGGKGVERVEARVAAEVLAQRSGDVWQQWLPMEDEEYTCGLFRVPGVALRSIIFRRKLLGGLTGSAVVVDSPVIFDALIQVAEAVDLCGSINVQLRMHEGMPFIFEINPRFSSTVGFRHRLGFQDVVWACQHILGRPIDSYSPAGIGTRIYRVNGEIIRPA